MIKHKILLYGSYARGEETSSSDIDIMILVDLDEFSIKNYADSLNEVTFDMNLDSKEKKLWFSDSKKTGTMLKY